VFRVDPRQGFEGLARLAGLDPETRDRCERVRSSLNTPVNAPSANARASALSPAASTSSARLSRVFTTSDSSSSARNRRIFHERGRQKLPRVAFHSGISSMKRYASPPIAGAMKST
jgi:hypothetical protein